jgi:hypothetical protein
MLFALIPIAWLLIAAVVIAVCKAAARADAQPAPRIETPGRTLRPGLVVWEGRSAPIRVRRPLGGRPLRHGARARSRGVAHSVR